MYSCRRCIIVLSDGVVAMALVPRREEGWFKPTSVNIDYRVYRRDRGWVRAAKVRNRRNIVVKSFSRTKNTTLTNNNIEELKIERTFLVINDVVVRALAS